MAEVVKQTSTGVGPAALVDMKADASDPNAQAFLAAIVPQGDTTWFFKLSGPVSLMGEQHDAFMALLASLKPESAHP